MKNDLDAIQRLVSNPLPESAAAASRFAAIIGDRPSQYAKSPKIWNPTIQRMGIDAVYVPLDVDDDRLPAVVEALREHPRLLGFNVTMPYKIRLLPLLDEVEEKARRIGAVNTVVRENGGRLVGYNTDGQGFIDCITQPQPGEEGPFLASIREAKALLLGAGGAAAAVAHYFAEAAPGGRLFIANRTQAAAENLADALRSAGGKADSIGEKEIASVVGGVDLIINTTVKGQTGLRKLADGTATCLEGYSCLAPASPASLSASPQGGEASFYFSWWEKSWKDLARNQAVSMELLSHVPARVRLYDAVYAPLETEFLRQGRLSGHRTMNGKGMNVCQAVDGFFNRVMAGFFKDLNLHTSETRRRVRDAMYEVW